MPLYTSVFTHTAPASTPAGAPADLPDFKRRLGFRESSGSYTIKGIPTRHGRALGKYQVMEEYLPGWSKQYLGRVVSPDEYLNSPELQEELIDRRFADLYKRYGNWDDVASVHFTGRPLAQAIREGARDGLGTTVQSYVRDINGSSPRLASATPTPGRLYTSVFTGAAPQPAAPSQSPGGSPRLYTSVFGSRGTMGAPA